MEFKLKSKYKPTGDQPAAIDELVKSIESGNREQTLLGVTGSGKTFTMANIIERTQRPTLVLATKLLRHSFAASLRSFSPTMRWSTLCLITITISRRHTLPTRILI